jgi:hypothetical protein
MQEVQKAYGNLGNKKKRAAIQWDKLGEDFGSDVRIFDGILKEARNLIADLLFSTVYTDDGHLEDDAPRTHGGAELGVTYAHPVALGPSKTFPISFWRMLKKHLEETITRHYCGMIGLGIGSKSYQVPGKCSPCINGLSE